MKSLEKQLQDLAHRYMRENGLDEIDLDAVVDWLIREKLYQREPMSLHKQCKRQLAQALRKDRFPNEQGNEVRRMHAVRIKDGSTQTTLWVDIRTAKPKRMRLSLQQGRRAIVAHAFRHKTDTEWYNEHNVYGATIPLFDYNLNNDFNEMKFPTEYREDKADNLDNDLRMLDDDSDEDRIIIETGV